ncbi:Maf family protein [Pelagibaculum spongiae]|nr:Maf family protein [Pelagibaculum spongiae]
MTEVKNNRLRLVLASSSAYRKALLEKLVSDFETASPQFDETLTTNESVKAAVGRLAQGKAQSLNNRFANSLIIGSDQLAYCDGQILGKPGNHQNATQQLLSVSGKEVIFYTGLCLLNTQTGQAQVSVETFHVGFRQLDEAEIDRYLKKDQPYDCAGSFKCESAGISLFRYMRGDDPNTLVGLPLIRLCEMLRQEGYALS